MSIKRSLKYERRCRNLHYTWKKIICVRGSKYFTFNTIFSDLLVLTLIWPQGYKLLPLSQVTRCVDFVPPNNQVVLRKFTGGSDHSFSIFVNLPEVPFKAKDCKIIKTPHRSYKFCKRFMVTTFLIIRESSWNTLTLTQQ